MGIFRFMSSKKPKAAEKKAASTAAEEEEVKVGSEAESVEYVSLSDEQPWWKGAIIYQVYPRSFCDTNGDGVGDIKGITTKMEYIASLGVDAIWVSPFMKSPMKDFGYDVSNYREVDPIFGDLDDFDEMLETAHEHGIKIIIDQVLSHTSDEHRWFQESRESRDNDKADFYCWADPNPDGTPPNNWLSIFGGSAWQFDSRREQYYLHNFLVTQPDLNFHNPRVQKEVLDNVEFWLKRGVDGFRLDAINFCFHDQELRDNPAKKPEDRYGQGFSTDNPYAYQYHYFNNTRPEMIDFLQRLRALMDQYPNIMTLGEVSSEDSLATMGEYTANNDKLHTAYSFEMLTDDSSGTHLRKVVESFHKRVKDGFPCWAIGNHDVQRVITRWGDNLSADAQVRSRMPTLFHTMLVTLRGSICIYQGEELGLDEADVAFEDLQDPYGITFWPKFKGRDGCRTPMPWTADEEFAGFSTSKPWLPVSDTHRPLAVDVQDADPDSVLNRFRDLLAWRRTQKILLYGNIQFLDAPETVLAFTRTIEDQKMICVFNLGGTDVTYKHKLLSNELKVTAPPLPEVLCAQQDGASLLLPPVSGFMATVVE